mgnify:CR=1 FL=1
MIRSGRLGIGTNPPLTGGTGRFRQGTATQVFGLGERRPDGGGVTVREGCRRQGGFAGCGGRAGPLGSGSCGRPWRGVGVGNSLHRRQEQASDEAFHCCRREAGSGGAARFLSPRRYNQRQ